jgi:hypothetical protein
MLRPANDLGAHRHRQQNPVPGRLIIEPALARFFVGTVRQMDGECPTNDLGSR